MTFVTKSYREITDSILLQITKGIVKERHDYVANGTKCKLDQLTKEIISIEGTADGASKKFKASNDEAANDFRLDARDDGTSWVEWIEGGIKPDDGTPFFVSYKIPAPLDITDVNPGSVINTIIESIAREMDYLYAQMDEVYDSAFIDTTSGKSMDLVAALLGITRKPASPASGKVTLSRDTDSDEIVVNNEPINFDGDMSYELINPFIKDITDVTGVSNKTSSTFALGKDYTLQDNAISWIKGGNLPDIDSIFYVSYSAYKNIIIPSGTIVSTQPNRQENIKTFKTTEDAVLSKSQDKWEVEVPVVATSPGKKGNAFGGAISLMPASVADKEHVINKMAIMNGTDAEDDAALRDRVKHNLEMKCKATTNALKYAIEGVSGVAGDVKVEDTEIPGLVHVLVSIKETDPNEIKRINADIDKVIEETRAAGIRVERFSPDKTIDISMTIFIENGADQTEIEKDIETAIRKYFGGLRIGDQVLLGQITKAAFNVSGVMNIQNTTISFNASTKPEDISVKSDARATFGKSKIDFKSG